MAEVSAAAGDVPQAVAPQSATRGEGRVFKGRRLLGLAVPLFLLIVWQALASFEVVRANQLPGPDAVLLEMISLWDLGELQGHIAITAWRVAQGFFWGGLAALVLGSLTGFSRLTRELLDPTIQALKAVPSLGWVPLFIQWFGIFELSKVVLIAVGVFFPVYLNLMSGILATDRKLVEVGQIYGLTRRQIVSRILLPATLPNFVTGLRSGLALGWMFVIAAELMGASQGLGYLMIDGQQTGRPTAIIGALILFALIGKASDWLLVRLTRRSLSWQDSFGAMGK